MPKFILIFYIYSSNHSLPHFWFYLRYINKSTFGLHMLSFNSFFYVLYLLLITVCQPAFGLTLDINKEKYTKLSVVLFPVVLRVANFFLPYFCSVVSLLCRKPVVWIFSTNYARSFYCSQFGGVVVFLWFTISLQSCQRFLLLWLCIKLLGNVVRVYPRIVQGLTFLSV